VAARGEQPQGTGRLVGGRYRLAERIGAGGMGTVWRAVDELVGREVAVKEPRLPGDPARAYARLQREARAAARVEHPSAVAVHDVVVEDGLPWIVMELVRGESLHEVLARGPLPPAEAARIGLAVLGALRAAHAKGIVHRDVKPANVLLGPHGRVVLTDFGIAQVKGEESLTVTGEFVGSLEGIAPERMSGDEAGPASDLWSLGVLLYAAVEGWSPFRRTTLESTLAAILSFDPPAPERAGALAPLIAALLTKDPAGRPDAARAEVSLAAAAEGRDDPGTLRFTIPGPVVETPPAPAPSPAPRRGRRLAVGALVCAVLVGGGTWLGVSMSRGSGDDAASDGKQMEATYAAAESPSASRDAGWTAHREKAVRAVVSVPDALTDVYHDPSGDGVQYADPRSDVTLTVKRWAPQPGGSTAAQWAASVARKYQEAGYGDLERGITRTGFHGRDAAQLDVTYRSENTDGRTREMHLYIVDGTGRYDLGVTMPKGVRGYEKQGTAAFKGARDRLRLEKS
jgi:serine/threonine protein kinase